MFTLAATCSQRIQSLALSRCFATTLGILRNTRKLVYTRVDISIGER